MVIGSRNLPASSNAPRTWRRRILGNGFNWMVRRCVGLPYRDTQAGLKGFRSAAARRLFAKARVRGFSFDVEILYLAKKYGYRVAEVPVRVGADHSYKGSKLKLMKDSLRMFWGLFRIRLYDLAGLYS